MICPNLIKRLLVVLGVIPLGYRSIAQTYGNEWIDYSKTYYKFNIGRDGIYRIPDSALVSLGLGAAPAQQFQLWHNGQQVPLYTSLPAGNMGDTDYIEFFGQHNNGTPDTRLYNSPSFQLTTGYSLFTDTSAYYLTLNPSGGNFRVTAAPNNVSNPGVPPEAYFPDTVSIYYSQLFNPGYAQLVSGDYFYASTFDSGEAFTSNYISPSVPLTQTINNIYVYPGGPPAFLEADAVGTAPNSRDLKVTLNGQTLADSTFSSFSMQRYHIANIPLTDLTGNSSTVAFVNGSSTGTDRVVVADLRLAYPSLLNFGGLSFFSFNLAPGAAPKYLVISNFASGGNPPVLYDLTNGLRLLGNTDSPGTVRFVLPASMQPRQLELSAVSAIQSPGPFSVRNFIDYSQPSNQGNFLIITNRALLNDGNGNDFVEQYRAYRASPAGGGFKAVTVMFDQLTDQFGYGIKFDPISIRNFCQFALNRFGVKPADLLLIGTGLTYDQYRFAENNPGNAAIQLVPTFGHPGSDVLLTAAPGGILPQIPIGRLSVELGGEIGVYLAKVKQFESLLHDSSQADQTLAGRGWTKNVLDIIGADDIGLQTLLGAYFNSYDNYVSDTFYGGNPYRIEKSSTSAVVQAGTRLTDSLFSAGLGLVHYFGHSSATTLGFNLDNPTQLGNAGKYPFFLANGCNAGAIFSEDTLRLQGQGILSEQFLFNPDVGAIGFIGSTSFGVTNVLDYYTTQLYRNFCLTNYGGTIGQDMANVVANVVTQHNDFLDDANAEIYNLDGDPAIRTYYSNNPDYDIEAQAVSFNPSIVTVAQGSIQLQFIVYNLGKAVTDSLTVQVKRITPNGVSTTLFSKTVPGPYFSDTFRLSVPVSGATDAGQNRFLFSLDPANLIQETTKSNNQLEKDLFIFENDIKPVYPFDNSIIGQSGFSFAASTADPFAPQAQYEFQLDTSGNFNSPLLIRLSASGIGGLYRFNPAFGLQNGQIYYWRVGKTPTPGQSQTWNGFSFLYALGDSAGWNQSRSFQYQENTLNNMVMDSTGIFRFTPQVSSLEISTVLYPFNTDNQKITENGFVYVENDGGDALSSLQFAMYNPVTTLPFINIKPGPGPFGGTYFNSIDHTNSDRANIDFQYTSLASRELILAFLDSIPPGWTVSMTNWASVTYLANNTFIKDWQADSTSLGSGHTLYDKLKQMGFTMVDSFYRNIPFIFYFRKNPDGSFTPLYQAVGNQSSDLLTASFTLTGVQSQGTMESPLIGPSRGWKEIQWHLHSLDPGGGGDNSSIQVFGVDYNGNSTLVYNNPPADTVLSFINPGTYPYLRLLLNTQDTVFGTPAQLDYWRVFYTQPPEGALAPNLFLNTLDTVTQGQPLPFSVAFANVSPTSFDSLAVNFTITDPGNVVHQVPVTKLRKLLVNDTLHLSASVDTHTLSGLNTLFVEANPNNSQPEQYHFNDFGYRQFYVKPGKFNPLLDVTFDGIHILNDDIVSARPHVLIRLSDQNKYQLLSDTSLMTLQIVCPDGSLHPCYFNNDTVRFTPADTTRSGSGNTAQVDFSPYFPVDGTYELVVTGRDPGGNSAGTVAYRVSFQIINKPMISNLLNYPNPFTTSTAFVFTLTGTEIPSQLKIEIMTITGKIVRVITREEVGPLHIGRNITQYKWNGTDQYGQKLANGIYLYRVVASLEGTKMTLYNSGADQYITRGYGKMYLMR